MYAGPDEIFVPRVFGGRPVLHAFAQLGRDTEAKAAVAAMRAGPIPVDPAQVLNNLLPETEAAQALADLKKRLETK